MTVVYLRSNPVLTANLLEVWYHRAVPRSAPRLRSEKKSSKKTPVSLSFWSSRHVAVGFMLLNTLVWGAALPIVKPGLEVTTAFLFLFERYALATLFTLPFLVWYFWKNSKLFGFLPRIIVLELIGTTLSLSLLYFGLERTTALESSLITTTVPVITIIGGVLFLREKQERREWFGLSLALAGTLLLVVEPVLSGAWRAAEFSLLGNLLVFGQNITISIYYILAKKWYRQVPKLFATGVSFLVGTVSFGFLSFWSGNSVVPKGRVPSVVGHDGTFLLPTHLR